MRFLTPFTLALVLFTFTANLTRAEGVRPTARVDVTDMTNPSPDEEPPQRPPVVGRKAAQKYMGVKPDNAPESGRGPASTGGGGSTAHYLALHIGTYVGDNAYHWGSAASAKDVGKWNAGVTYRMGEWVNSMDLCLRIDYSTFSLPGGNASKLSLLPVVLFPDANSRFPLYFGGGLGAGVMTKQLEKESQIALDYQLLLGARFFDVVQTTGFFIEAGIKNHVHLLSDGQFNGTFISAGTVFTF